MLRSKKNDDCIGDSSFSKKVSTHRQFDDIFDKAPDLLLGRNESSDLELYRISNVSYHLSSDIQIEGDLNCSTDLIFDGAITGNINSKGSLTIGQNASVKGDLKAEKAIIEGKVAGDGDFNSCRLSSTSVISGSVSTVSLQMQEGASLEGQCKFGKAKA